MNLASDACFRRLTCLGLLLAASSPARAVMSDGTPTPNPSAAEVAHAPATKMEPYTVDESKSLKTHTLFMGADFAVKLDRDSYGVSDVHGSNWVVNIAGRPREISSRSAVDLKITPSLKLTEGSAEIVGFKQMQTFSYANDPSVLLTRGLSQSASISSDLLAVAQNAQHKVDVMGSNNMGAMSTFAGSDDQFSSNAMMATAMYVGGVTHPGKGLAPSGAVATTSTDTSGKFSGDPTRALNFTVAETAANGAAAQAQNANKPVGKIVTGGLDALDVDFEVRSAKIIRNPYVVTITRFHPAGAKPGVVQNLVYAKSLDPIDEHLSHVHFVEDGFPFNYEVVDFQLHLYNRGKEIATTVAKDRVELTRDEAFEFIKMEYVGAHAKDTLAAEPAMAKFPSDLPFMLSQGKYRSAFYVRVDRDGHADSAYADLECTKKVNDPYLDEVVGRIRFKPALKSGRPVPGTATVNLNTLTF